MSHSAISAIAKLRIPTNSYIAAAQAAGAMRTECDHGRYDEYISKIIGKPHQSETYKEAQMTFGYLVQGIVRMHVCGFEIDKDIDTILICAQMQANKFIQDQPWHWPETEDGGGKVSRIEEVRRVVALFEGIDRELLIERLAADFEVSRATAQGYLRQLDNEREPEEAPVAPKVKINKGAEAAKLVEETYNGTNKSEVIAAIVAKLNTTKGGAQTFFYAAVKKLGLSTKAPEPEKASSTQEQLRAFIEADPSIDRKTFIEKAAGIGVKATTAQTYYYSITTSLGVERKGTGARGRKRSGSQSRIEQVIEVVKANSTLSKAEMIDKLSSQFTVSKVSAQSYYYAALKAIKETNE